MTIYDQIGKVHDSIINKNKEKHFMQNNVLFKKSFKNKDRFLLTFLFYTYL